jgi:hypothetical protein
LGVERSNLTAIQRSPASTWSKYSVLGAAESGRSPIPCAGRPSALEGGTGACEGRFRTPRIRLFSRTHEQLADLTRVLGFSAVRSNRAMLRQPSEGPLSKAWHHVQVNREIAKTQCQLGAYNPGARIGLGLLARTTAPLKSKPQHL